MAGIGVGTLFGTPDGRKKRERSAETAYGPGTQRTGSPAVEPTSFFVALVFMLAGTVKGAVGLGLPPIAMGLLVIVMPPVEAAALLVVPSVVTNAWQMLAGPYFMSLVRRIWPLLLCAVAGTLVGTGWLAAETARIGTAILGAVLVVYAVGSLVSMRAVPLGPAAQRWAGPLAGGSTGLITAATGVSAIPAVPYLHAIGLEKDELVQAMGLSFTVSTVALAANLASVGALSWSLGPAAAGALAAVLVGIGLGQAIRRRLDAATFRVWFLWGLLLLGLYLAARSMI